MPKQAVFAMRLEAALHAEFMIKTAGENRPASQVMRELISSADRLERPVER